MIIPHILVALLNMRIYILYMYIRNENSVILFQKCATSQVIFTGIALGSRAAKQWSKVSKCCISRLGKEWNEENIFMYYDLLHSLN